MTELAEDGQEPLFGAEPRKVMDVQAHELLLRFAFGAGISLVAGVVSIVFNPVAGGLFLAFPAILPATITLIERRDGTAAAVTDVQGAAIGTVGLVAFAATAGYLLHRTGAPLSMTVALLAWLLTSVAGYVTVEIPRRRLVSPTPSAGRPGRSPRRRA